MLKVWLEKSARAGYTKAQYQLGKLLSKAAENPADERAGRRWPEAAASAGHADAQYRLARRFIVMAEPESQRTAYRWFKRAADDGHLPAAYSVGVCHLKGRGANEDPVQAYRWFRLAAAEGYDSATRALEKLDPATLARARDSDTRPAG